MRVILANLPWTREGRFGVRAGSRWPFTSEPEKCGYIKYIPFPFFLAYAASLLKNNGNEVKLIDAIAEGIDERSSIREINNFNPGLIVLEVSSPSFENDMNIAHNIHQELPFCQIALCGPHASVFYEQILKEYKFVSYVLIGEYEYILLDLVNCLEKGSDLAGIAGLVYRNSNRIQVNNLRPAIGNLDGLPWPERDSLNIYKYNDGFAGLPQPNVQMWASRGCPFHCTFCLWPQAMYREHKYRKRSYVDVVDEMEYLINKFGFKAVYFDDDVFNADRKFVLDICNEMLSRGIKTPWAAMARADLMDEECLAAMAKAGLFAIKYGIESANRNILNLCKKNIDLDKAQQAVRITKSLGIKVHLTFCLGLPGETKQTIQETIDYINAVQPDSVQFSFATPFPGTEYYSYLEQKGYLLSEKFSDYDGNYKCVIRTEGLNGQEIENIKSYIYQKLDF